MGHKTRLNQNKKRNRKEEPNYFEYLIQVIPTVGESKIHVDEVKNFMNGLGQIW